MGDVPSIDAELAAQLCELREGELSDRELWDFVRESNAIESIHRPPSYGELNELVRFLSLDTVTIDDLVQFVSVYQPDAVLRDRPDLPGVRVGKRMAPMGFLQTCYYQSLAEGR